MLRAPPLLPRQLPVTAPGGLPFAQHSMGLVQGGAVGGPHYMGRGGAYMQGGRGGGRGGPPAGGSGQLGQYGMGGVLGQAGRGVQGAGGVGHGVEVIGMCGTQKMLPPPPQPASATIKVRVSVSVKYVTQPAQLHSPSGILPLTYRTLASFASLPLFLSQIHCHQLVCHQSQDNTQPQHLLAQPQPSSSPHLL